MARNRWIPEHLHRPAGHEDREHHANVDEDVQYNEDYAAPSPVLTGRYAHQHDSHGDFTSCLGSGRELKGDPCEFHGMHDAVWIECGGMPSQTVVSGTPQKTEGTAQEDLMGIVSHFRCYTSYRAAEPQDTLQKTGATSSHPLQLSVRSSPWPRTSS